MQLQVSVGPPDGAGLRPVEIHARPEDLSNTTTPDTWTRHASGLLGISRDAERSSNSDDISKREIAHLAGAWPPVGAKPAQDSELYALLADRGLEYGPMFQGAGRIWRRGEELFAEVTLPEDRHEQGSLFQLHPALLDAALHPAVGLFEQTGEQVSLPFCWREVSVYREGASALRVRLSAAGKDAISLLIADEDGAMVASVGSLLLRPVASELLRRGSEGVNGRLLGIDWVSIPSAPKVPAEQWVLLGGEDSDLLGSLREAGMDVVCYSDLDSLVAAVRDGMSVPPVVLGRRVSHAEGLGLASAVRRAVRETHELIRAWLLHEELADSCLAIVTEGAVATRAGEDLPGLADSATWGLTRSAQSEHPDRLLLIDLEGGDGSGRLLACAVAGAIEGDESQVAIRAGALYAPRLGQAGSGALSPPAGVSEWRLEPAGTGALDDLRLVAAPEANKPLEPDEVRVAIRSAGLNFRDVMTALGIVPRGGEWDMIGNEAAGIVSEVGASVRAVVPGERVMGLFSGGFGPLGVTDRRQIVKVPHG